MFPEPDLDKRLVTRGGPTVRDVTTIYKRAQKESLAWHRNIKRWRRLYDFNHYKSPPLPGEERYDDPAATNTVDLAVGVLLANEMEWRAHGWTSSIVEEQETSHVEKYVAGLIEINNEREEVNIPYEVIMHFVRDGAAVLYSVWDPELAKISAMNVPVMDEQSGQMMEMPGFRQPPIVVQVVDPLKIFLVPGGPRRWAAVLKVERMSVYDIEHMFGVRLPAYDRMNEDAKRNSYHDLIDCWKLVDKPLPDIEEVEGEFLSPAGIEMVQTPNQFVVQHAMVYSDHAIWEMHDTAYDEMPFRIGFFKPVDREKADGWGHSIIRPMETTLKLVESAINRRSRQINVFSVLPMTIKAHSSRNVDIDPSIMNVIELDTDEDIGFPTWPGNPPDVDRQIQFFSGKIQQSSFPESVFGQGPSQVAGFALSQMSDQGRIRLNQPIVHLEQLWSRWAKQVLRLTATFGDQTVMRVSGVMKGRDFAEQIFSADLANYTIKAKVKPKFPMDDVRNHALGTQTAGVLSERTRMERYYDIEQPDEERKRRLQEMAQNHPAMQQYAIISALMELANSGDPAAVLALQQLMSGGMQAGPQPQGPAPEQMMGGAGPTGQFPPQAAGGAPPGQTPLEGIEAEAGRSPGMLGGI